MTGKRISLITGTLTLIVAFGLALTASGSSTRAQEPALLQESDASAPARALYVPQVERARLSAGSQESPSLYRALSEPQAAEGVAVDPVFPLESLFFRTNPAEVTPSLRSAQLSAAGAPHAISWRQVW